MLKDGKEQAQRIRIEFRKLKENNKLKKPVLKHASCLNNHFSDSLKLVSELRNPVRFFADNLPFVDDFAFCRRFHFVDDFGPLGNSVSSNCSI